MKEAVGCGPLLLSWLWVEGKRSRWLRHRRGPVAGRGWSAYWPAYRRLEVRDV